MVKISLPSCVVSNVEKVGHQLLILSLHYVTATLNETGAATWNALSERHNDLKAKDTRTRQTGRRARQTKADSLVTVENTPWLCHAGEISESPDCPPLSFSEWRNKKIFALSD